MTSCWAKAQPTKTHTIKRIDPFLSKLKNEGIHEHETLFDHNQHVTSITFSLSINRLARLFAWNSQEQVAARRRLG